MSWETSQLALKIAQNQSLVIPSQLLHDFSCTAQLKVVDQLHETNVSETACSEHLDALFDTVQCGFIGKFLLSYLYSILITTVFLLDVDKNVKAVESLVSCRSHLSNDFMMTSSYHRLKALILAVNSTFLV